MSRRPFRPPRSLCCVYGCDYRRKPKSEKRFFKFPKKSSVDNVNKSLFWLWISAAKISKRFSNDMRICERHFADEDFIIKDNDKNLNPTAIPSKNLPKVWRNKFFPRDYGKLIKQIEIRGIGKLRLCSEAKLCRLLKKCLINKGTMLKKDNDTAKKSLGAKLLEVEKRNGDHQAADSTAAKTSASNLLPSDPFTSEIDIKDEPISDQDEAIENLLATLDEGPIPRNEISRKDGDATGSCTVCGRSRSECLCSSQKARTCMICSQLFNTAKQKSDHMATAHRPSSGNNMSEMSCQICMIAFQTQDQLEEHNQILHSKPLPRSHVCLLCNESFKSKVELMDHVTKHAMIHSFPCKVCSSFFNTKNERDVHFRGHGITRKEYECRECGDILKTKAACWEHRNNHIRARLKRGFPCDVCGRVLSTRMTLKEHTARHLKEKPYECQLCGRQIRSKMDFLLHVQGHTLGLPHKCSYCGMSFQKKSELNVHVSNEHWKEERSKNSSREPFDCSICGLKFKTESGFLKHAVTHNAFLEDEENDVNASA